MIPAFLRDAIAIWRFVRDVDRAIAPIQAGMRDAAEAARRDPRRPVLTDPEWREHQTISVEAYTALPLDVRRHYVAWKSAAGAPPHRIVAWVHLGVDAPRPGAPRMRETMRIAVDTGDGIARSFVGVVERRKDGGLIVHSVTEPLREDPSKPEIGVGDYVRHAWNPCGRQAWMCVEEAPDDRGYMRADGWNMHRDAVTEHRARPRITLPEGREVGVERMWGHGLDACADIEGAAWLVSMATGAWKRWTKCPWSDSNVAHLERVWPPLDLEPGT